MLVNRLWFSKFNHFTFDEFIRELLKLVRNGQSVSCKNMRVHGVDNKMLSAGPAYSSRDEEDVIPEPMSSDAVSTTHTSPVSAPRTTTLTSSDRDREDLHAESQFSSGEEDEMILPSTSHSQTSTSTSSSGHSTSSGRGTTYRPTAGTTMRAAINTAGMAGATYNPTTGVSTTEKINRWSNIINYSNKVP
jgi:hypothetical protein